jgi:rhamnosyltransferase
MTTAVGVILVKNGSQYLTEVIGAAQNQKTSIDYRILAIDSGSTDGSLEILAHFGVDTHRIEPEDFNHGDTRNLGAEIAGDDTDFVVYLTQDATPADAYWLAHLVRPLQRDARAAGAFSRHIPRPDSSPALIRQLTQNWQSGQCQRIVKEMPDQSSVYERDKMFYVYFSDTSSVIRRSVWDTIRFPTTDFAEDAAWADRVICAGHRIVFEPDSMVIHSHDYSLVEQFRQNVDHAAGMCELFPGVLALDTVAWLRAFAGVAKEARADWQFIRESERYASASLFRKLIWALHSPQWHLASISGTWLGARWSRVPSSMRVAVSRQERLRRGELPGVRRV